MKNILILGLLALSFTLAQPIAAPIFVQTTEPTSNLTQGTLWFDTSTNTLKVITTTSPTTWASISGNTGSGSTEVVPTGSILIIESGSCPTGYAESITLNGKFPVGTIASNADITTTGGNNNIIPTGTNSALTFTGSSATTNAVTGGTPSGIISTPTFTGNALANHAHELPYQIPTPTTIRQIAVATFGTGTSRAATAVSAAGTANTTSAAVALSQSVSAGTPSGTISTPIFTGSALATHSHTLTATGTINTPTFTGNLFDNRPEFVRVIFCKKS